MLVAQSTVEAVLMLEAQALAGTEFEGGSTQPGGRLTVSVGVAELQDSDDMASLMRRADEALYRAKQSGRNRVEA